MRLIRALIIGSRVSFVNPIRQLGYRILPIPPLSTIYALLSAAYGSWLTLKDVPVGFVFFGSQQLSTSSSIKSGQSEFDQSIYKQSVLSRETALDEIDEPRLWLYTPSMWMMPYLKEPRYPLYWGRYGQRAYIAEAKEVELAPSRQTVYMNTLLPFPDAHISACVEWLPTSLSADFPRRPLDIRPFYVVIGKIELDVESMFDTQKGWSVFVHGSCE